MFHLLFKKKFGPFFWTQFLGAFNDNVFKNALVILMAYKATSEADSGFYVSLAGGLFILPFFLFSSLAGEIADQMNKSRLISWIKIWEIIAMAMAAIGFWFDYPNFLLFVLFLMGTHSAFFGPVKYSILPEHLKDEADLVGANALVEMGTFLAILIGTILGGVLVGVSTSALSVGVILFAVLGYITSLQIPRGNLEKKSLNLTINPISQFKNLYHASKQSQSIFFSIIAISWFWFVGGIFLSQIPTFVKYSLHADQSLVTILLGVFTFSLACGSVLYNRLANKKIEVALVPFGILGLSIFSLALGSLSYDSIATPTTLLTLQDLISGEHRWLMVAVLLDFFLIGCFGSLFIVPLYALLQKRSEKDTCSQVIAANNVFNSVFMVVSTIFTMVCYSLGLSTAQLFSVVAILNFLFLLYGFYKMPEFLFRFISWIQQSTVYQFDSHNSNLPADNTLIIVQDYALKDWVWLTFITQKPVVLITCSDSPHLSLEKRFLLKIWKSVPLDEFQKFPSQKQQKIFAKNHLCLFTKNQKIIKELEGSFGEFHPNILMASKSVIKEPCGIIGLFAKIRITYRFRSVVPGSNSI